MSPPRPGPAAVSTPGRWQHPRMEEVLQRQRASVFDSRHLGTVIINALLIVLSFLVPRMAEACLPIAFVRYAEPYSSYFLNLLRAFFLVNMVIAFKPLYQSPDTCEDIPLTPAQRKLLGLPPMSRPATPHEQAQWVTPPRYSRNSTPQGRGASFHRSTSESPFKASPRAPSRNSGELEPWVSRGSPLGLSDREGGVATPSKNNRASVGLNTKWLYERGRGSTSGYSGSVFM
ncbi:hypothetical protein K470DRAFT_208656 [Piedraia hortae CBS 480.64]|uniref:NPCC-domain-containing protein n=1 Tax=Piedraia hortae CBS 480.64 TaxID=1314780 RepID=A0A6A7CBT7_9PEZI|nr:hypothetical protein K470DRAFT_208656 [Piedraia hortae CBS 480.64]